MGKAAGGRSGEIGRRARKRRKETGLKVRERRRETRRGDTTAEVNPRWKGRKEGRRGAEVRVVLAARKKEGEQRSDHSPSGGEALREKNPVNLRRGGNSEVEVTREGGGAEVTLEGGGEAEVTLEGGEGAGVTREGGEGGRQQK